MVVYVEDSGVDLADSVIDSRIPECLRDSARFQSRLDNPEDQRGILRDEKTKDSDMAGGAPEVAVGSAGV
jgi:hypothetical protein